MILGVAQVDGLDWPHSQSERTGVQLRQCLLSTEHRRELSHNGYVLIALWPIGSREVSVGRTMSSELVVHILPDDNVHAPNHDQN